MVVAGEWLLVGGGGGAVVVLQMANKGPRSIRERSARWCWG